jgi:hypothetical protein
MTQTSSTALPIAIPIAAASLLPLAWATTGTGDFVCDPAWQQALQALQRPWQQQAPSGLAHRLLLEPAAPGDAALGPRSLFNDHADPAYAVALGIDGLWPRATLADARQLARALSLDAARWHRDQALRTEMERARTQLDERRWVERAKGVLMQARGLSEEEAFRLLRGASMQSNLRVGEVSRSVTEAAQWAEAVNRAGQLRMLSQRVVKLAAQRLDGIDPRRARQIQGMAIGRVQDNLGFLASLPVMRDSGGSAHLALDAATQAWRALKPVLMQRLTPATLAQSDALGEALLECAEALTDVLEAGGARRALRLVNLCGRQRMRVQRLAKQALLAVLLNQPERQDALPGLLDEVESTLLELERAPLGSPRARETLAQAREHWLHLLRGLRLAQGHDGRQALAVASDALLDLFDQLTADYEHSLQTILS